MNLKCPYFFEDILTGYMYNESMKHIKYILLFVVAVSLYGAAWGGDRMADERKVLVQATGVHAVVSAWARYGDEWVEEFRTEDGWVGRNGVTDQKKEGDGKTPVGVYEMRRAFGIASKPETAFPYHLVVEGDEWVDDALSPFYNQFVPATAPVERTWNSSEKLNHYPVEYAYALVIEYNTDSAIHGAGSGIFFHCSSNKPTSGCVSVPEDFMVRLLMFLQPGDKIVIEAAEE